MFYILSWPALSIPRLFVPPRLAQFHQKRKASSTSSLSLLFPWPPSLHFLYSLTCPNPVFSGCHPCPSIKAALDTAIDGPYANLHCWPSPSFMNSLLGIIHILLTLLVNCSQFLELVFHPFMPFKCCTFLNGSIWMHMGLRVEGWTAAPDE